MTTRKGGKPRKPTAKHKLDGTYRGDRHAGLGEVTFPDADLKPPAELNEAGRGEWNALAPDLHRQGMLTRADRTAFTLYCQAYADYASITRKLNRKGAPDHGTPKRKDMVLERMKAYTILKDVMARFGFTPSDRAGLPAAPPKEPEPAGEDVFGDGLKAV